MTRAAPIEGRTSTGVWGAVGAGMTFGVVVAYFCYAHLYLAVSNEPWPPATAPALPLLAPALHVAFVAVLAAVAVRAGRPLADRTDQLTRGVWFGIVAALGAVALVAGGLLVAALDLDPAAHAHDASAMTLHVVVGVAGAVGVVISALVAYEAARLGDHPWVAAAVAVAGVWWVTVAASWLAVAAVVYGSAALT